MYKIMSKTTNILNHLVVVFTPVITLVLVMNFFWLEMCGMGILERYLVPFKRLGIYVPGNVVMPFFFVCLIGTPVLGTLACWTRLRERSIRKGEKAQLLILLFLNVLLVVACVYCTVRSTWVYSM